MSVCLDLFSSLLGVCVCVCVLVYGMYTSSQELNLSN